MMDGLTFYTVLRTHFFKLNLRFKLNSGIIPDNLLTVIKLSYILCS
jgi:hypothetical protein